MHKTILPLLILVTGAAFAACSNNDPVPYSAPATVQNEVEPNGDTLTSAAMTLGRPVAGDVTTIGDADFWSIALAMNETLQVEVFGTRFDHATWDANANTPKVTILGTDGTTAWLVQDTINSPGLGWGEIDADIPRFVAPADGTYYVVVERSDTTVDGGAYALVASLVTLPGTLQFEVEATAVSGVNDSAATAETVTPGTIAGFHVDGEEDWYKFTVTAPSEVSYVMWGHRNGVWSSDDDSYDPEVEIVDADGTTVLSNIDDYYFYDSSFKYVITTPGDYYINVFECCGSGDAAYQLDLMVTPWTTRAEVEPNDDTATGDPLVFDECVAAQVDNSAADVYTFSGTAGDTVRLKYFDSDSLEGSTSTVSIDMRDATDATIGYAFSSDATTLQAILPATGTFNFIVTTGSVTPVDYALCLNRVRQATWEVEPNDDIVTAIALDANGRGAGLMDTGTDVDAFSFTAQMDHLVTISCYASASAMNAGGFYNETGNGSSVTPLLEIKDGTDTVIASSTAAWANCSAEGIVDGKVTMAVSFVAPADGTYYVEISDTLGLFDPTSYYVIERR